MMKAKGKLITKKKIKRMSADERRLRAKERVMEKLGKKEYDKVQKQFSKLVASTSSSSRPLIDGMIMGLIQQSLSNRQIRHVFRVGNNRINRIRKVIRDPELLKTKRPAPKHAASIDDIEQLKAHLATYSTEDGYPCAHRRQLKYFLVQRLT